MNYYNQSLPILFPKETNDDRSRAYISLKNYEEKIADMVYEDIVSRNWGFRELKLYKQMNRPKGVIDGIAYFLHLDERRSNMGAIKRYEFELNKR
jgi:hypothetical protein